MLHFDIDTYRHHSDLKNMSDEQLRQHFETFGKNECRIYDLKSIHFNWRFYLQFHHDLRPAGIRSRNQAISHFVNFGCKEFRKLHQDDILHPDFKKSRICVFYAYYERLFDRKNQTNIMFFISQTIQRQWELSPSELQFVFLINGTLGCSVYIPEQDNIIILNLPDINSDFHAYRIGIEYLQNLYVEKDLSNKFDYLIFMNCSCFGPVLDQNNSIHQQHWIFPFYSKMTQDSAAACSPCISYLEAGMPEGIGPRMVSTFIMCAWTKHIQELLLDTPISSIDESSTNVHGFGNQSNTVIGPKRDKVDAILTGEYGFSRILLQYGYHLTCLLYDHIIDFDDPQYYNLNNQRAPDRYHAFFGENIPFYKTVFIKNVWRCEGHSMYASLPVLYEECMHYMYNICNFGTIFQENDGIQWDYESLPNCKRKGCHSWEKNHSWVTKQRYYELYGYAEETIIFPQHSLDKIEHVSFFFIENENNSIRTYLIEMIQTLIAMNYDIVLNIPNKDHEIIFSSPHIKIWDRRTNANDFWEECKKKFEQYRYQMFVTDHVIFPCHGFSHMKEQLLSLSSQWKFSNELFQINSQVKNIGFQDTSKIENFFADSFTNNNRNNPVQNFLKRFNEN